MSPPARNPPWAEVVQLIPVLVLAVPFIVQGEVDLSRATGGLVAGTLLFGAISGALAWRGYVLNPILVGTGLWLAFGAFAFVTGADPLTTWLADTQAFGLFVAAWGVGAAATAWSPHGFVGVRSGDAAWIRQASVGLLLLATAAVGWAWLFRHDIRIGGGLPFIVLNVARRLMTMRAP